MIPPSNLAEREEAARLWEAWQKAEAALQDASPMLSDEDYTKLCKAAVDAWEAFNNHPLAEELEPILPEAAE